MSPSNVLALNEFEADVVRYKEELRKRRSLLSRQ